MRKNNLSVTLAAVAPISLVIVALSLVVGCAKTERAAAPIDQSIKAGNDTGAAEAQANESGSRETEAKEGMQADMKADKTGTNPINFTYDLRLYNEYQWLNVPGDGDQNVTTLEFRAPFADGKWQFRTRMRATYLDIDRAGVDEFGFGDMDIRFLTVPYLNRENRTAFAYGLEIFIPTGSDDIISTNAFALGPQVFFAWFAPFGGLVDLIAPGYQHQFSVYEEDGASNVHLGLIDLFILKTFNDKQQWVMINPQGILNYEAQTEWVQLDVEVGTMFKTAGHSAYIRPSFGIGNDRPYDFSLEIGYKIVW